MDQRGVNDLQAFVLGIRWWLLRVAFGLTLTGNLLRWRAGLRSGVIPLTSLVMVRPSAVRGMLAFVHTGGPPVHVMVTKEFRQFLVALSEARLDLPVYLGLYGRLLRWRTDPTTEGPNGPSDRRAARG